MLLVAKSLSSLQDSVTPRAYPALKRWAKLFRAYGALQERN